jgi:hypothetical protein
MMKRLLIRYEWLVLIGLILSSMAIFNVIGWTDTNSDLFWAIAGLGLGIEGIIELYYEGKEETASDEHRFMGRVVCGNCGETLEDK